MTIRIAAFYKFFDFPGFEAARPCLSETLEAAGVRGTVLLAAEGINGTIAASPEGIETALAALRACRVPRRWKRNSQKRRKTRSCASRCG